MILSVAQLDQLLRLAKRDHNGEVVVEAVERKGLNYVKIAVLLDDMGDGVPPLHTFLLSPRGILST